MLQVIHVALKLGKLIDLPQKASRSILCKKMGIIPRVEKETHVANKSKYRGTREFELSQSSERAGLLQYENMYGTKSTCVAWSLVKPNVENNV